MSTTTLELIKKTVPEHLHDEVMGIFDSSREEVERMREAKNRYKRYHKGDGKQSTSTDTEGKSKADEAGNDDNAKADALGIARVIMKLWSAKMFRYAEELILNKAIKEKFFDERLKPFIYVFEQDDKENHEDDWVIHDQDEVIIVLVWSVFNVEQFYNEIRTHRSLIQESYDRIKEFVPQLHPEVIERHDLSKFAFSQALGYTLKFVHGIDHPIWKAACDLHLQSEPHHPKTWAQKYTPEKKKSKLEDWCRLACDFGAGCAYGLNLDSHNYDSEDFPVPFLWESYIDMMAVEWERKKGQRKDISLSELIYMDEKFLMRYSDVQRKMIIGLVNRVLDADDAWKNAGLSDREALLLSTVPERERRRIILKLEALKKSERARQEKLFSRNESPVSGPSCDLEELVKRAANMAFHSTLATVVMNVWDKRYRKNIEQLVLKRAIGEKYIKEEHLKWIFFVEQDEDGNTETEFTGTTPSSDECEEIVKLIWEDYNMREHFSQMKEHRFWIMRSYQRLSKFVPEVTEEIIERHDLSKFAFSQAVGYTLKWVHDINSSVWKKACDLHLNAEPHHPQMWANRHSPEYKQSCLEAFLCLHSGGAKYGVQISQINLTTENMALVFLLESFIDMVGVEWERNKNKRDDLTYTELVYMEEKFLNRYTEQDKAYLLRFMEKVRDEDKLVSRVPSGID